MIQIIKKENKDCISEIIRICKKDMFSERSDDFLDSLAEKFSKSACFLAAYSDEKLAGYVAFYCNDTVSKTAFISIIVVKKCFQRIGLGSTLIDEAISTSKKNGMKRIRLEVDKNNEKAIAFYKKKGFKIESDTETIYMTVDI